MRNIALIFIFLLLTTGCWSRQDIYSIAESVKIAQRCMQVKNFNQAASILVEYLSTCPEDIVAWRMLQDTLPETQSVEARNFEKCYTSICPVRFRPYLQARRIVESKEKMVALQKLEVNAEIRIWLSMDIAQLHLQNQDTRNAKQYLGIVLHDMPNYAEGHLLAAWIALLEVDWECALESARRAHDLDVYLIKPYFFEAANSLISGDYSGSLHIFRKIRILFPEYCFNTDEKFGNLFAFWREIAALLEEELWQNAIGVIDEALIVFPDHPMFLTFKAKALWEIGETSQATVYAGRSHAIDPYRLQTVQIYRSALCYERNYRKAYEIWKNLVPREIFDHPENQLRQHYFDLERAVYNVSRDKSSTLVELARAMTNIGWEEDAAIVYDHVENLQVENERKELQRHLHFMREFRKLFHTAYSMNSYQLVLLIDHIDKLALKWKIPLHTIPSRELDTYLMVVKETDPFATQANSLAAYLAKYNKCFDLGNNYGHIEARVMNRISVRHYHREIWGKWYDYSVIVGDESFVDSYLGYHSGAPKIAGRAFLSSKGFYLALDTIRPSLHSIKEIYQRLQNPAPIVPDIPLQEHFPYFKGIADALLKRSFESVPLARSDAEQNWQILYEETIKRYMDVVHNHELGHTVDFYCFFPWYARLGEILEMAWREKFSPQNIHSRFEATAEIFGLAHTQYPYYYLYQEMERLNVAFTGVFGWVPWAWYGKLPSEDPYYLSAAQIFQRLCQKPGEIENVLRLSKYSPDEILSFARNLCRERNMARDCRR